MVLLLLGLTALYEVTIAGLEEPPWVAFAAVGAGAVVVLEVILGVRRARATPRSSRAALRGPRLGAASGVVTTVTIGVVGGFGFVFAPALGFAALAIVKGGGGILATALSGVIGSLIALAATFGLGVIVRTGAAARRRLWESPRPARGRMQLRDRLLLATAVAILLAALAVLIQFQPARQEDPSRGHDPPPVAKVGPPSRPST